MNPLEKQHETINKLEVEIVRLRKALGEIVQEDMATPAARIANQALKIEGVMIGGRCRVT